MALSPLLLAGTSFIPWRLGCAASLPALSLLHASLTKQLPTSTPFSTLAHSTQLQQQQPFLGTTYTGPPSATFAAQVCSKTPSSFSTTAGLLSNSSWSGGRDFGETAGKPWRAFSSWEDAPYGLRTFSATPLRQEEECQAPESQPVLANNGAQHRSQRQSKHRIEHAMQILQHGNVMILRDLIAEKAETNFHITYNELLNMIKTSGAAHTQEEAEQLAEALNRAGQVLRYRNIVYLRPLEVAEIVLKALPDSEIEAEEKVREIDAELQAMRQKIDPLEKSATRWARVWLWGGCGMLAVQLAAFVRLTWWELSWDVMEPIAYVIGLTNTLLGYIYFMVFHNNLDYKPFQDYWKHRTKSKAAMQQRVDLERYEDLVKLRARYVRHMQAIVSDMKKSQVTAAN